jgi:hypothetical protein
LKSSREHQMGTVEGEPSVSERWLKRWKTSRPTVICLQRIFTKYHRNRREKTNFHEWLKVLLDGTVNGSLEGDTT